MATSPVDPEIIATASEDTTVRIWSLKPAHERQPCIFLLGGEGHLWNLLTVVRCALIPARPWKEETLMTPGIS